MAYSAEASKKIRNRARKIVAANRARALQYFAAVEQCRKDGYSPQYCVHGTYLWREYDVICGGCEDGHSAYKMLNMPFMEALEQARAEYREMLNALDAYRKEEKALRNIFDPMNLSAEECEKVTTYISHEVSAKRDRYLRTVEKFAV